MVTCTHFTFLQRNRTQHRYIAEYNIGLLVTLYCEPVSLASSAAATCLPRHMGHWTARLFISTAPSCRLPGRQSWNRRHRGHSHSIVVLSEQYRHSVSQTVSVTTISASLKSTGSHLEGKLIFSVFF